jgi:hypothetical protein
MVLKQDAFGVTTRARVSGGELNGHNLADLPWARGLHYGVLLIITYICAVYILDPRNTLL